MKNIYPAVFFTSKNNTLIATKRKKIFGGITTIFLFIFIFGIFQSLSAQYLHVSGKKILDEERNEIILRGIGLGGWMLQEGYMLRTSGPQHEIEAKIVGLIGEEKKEEFYEAWLRNHFRKIDVDSMASWGYNSIRLPMHYKLFTPPIEEEPVPGEITWIDKGFEMVDELLDWVEENNMYLILDMHAAPGGQGENADISDYDRSKPSLWESEANQDKLVALWKKLAERYANEPHIGAYDIINEPNWGFQNHASDLNGCAESQNTPLWNLQKRITEAIREVDQNHIVIIEGNCWGNNYSGLPTLWDDNLVISYHKYWNSNEQSSIQGMLNMRDQRSVPIWLGETGENSNTWFTDAIMLLEGNNIGWSWWPQKKMGRNNPLEIVVNDGYQDILDYWSGSGVKPSQDEAYSSLMELTENLKLENNIFHPDVVDAMIRQPHSDEAIPYRDHTIVPGVANRIFAVDYDMGRHGVAYKDEEYTNETGNAGGLAWNQGYSYRNDGVDIESCSDAITNGYNVGWTVDGEWLQYTVDVDSSGVYQIDVRYAAQSNGARIKIAVNNTDQTSPVELPATGGYQIWATQTIQDVILYKGRQRLRFFIEKGGFNFNYLELTLKKKVSEVNFRSVSGETSGEGDAIFLAVNKITDASTLSHTGFILTVNGKEVVLTGVGVDPGNDQRIKFLFEGELNDDSEILLSYEGSEILATDGTALEAFSDLVIANNLPVHFKIPTQIEAEDFYYNYGLQLEMTSDVGGGENIGYTNVGDYLDYLIFVEEADEYPIEVRVACNSQAGILEFQQLDKDYQVLNSKQINVPVTGGWQTWQTVHSKMDLDAGRGFLRVKIIQPELNVNWFRFSKAGVVNGLDDGLGSIKIYPNPARDHFTVEVPAGAAFHSENSLSIWELNGKLIYQSYRLKAEELRSMEFRSFLPGLYLVELNIREKSWIQKVVVE